MNSFVISLNNFSDDISDAIIETCNLNPFGLHFILFETELCKDENEFLDYVNHHGLPSDVSIKVLKECYPVKDRGDATNMIIMKEDN